ncbi:zinc transporter ZIP1 [Aplysia californica]|uniref:Zinc transporter ZIP1 n=1 Tax=Aplysia californica TaxID=6500 RepID=A0ABM0JVR1_APLCA|nr:zinc transporter ZIP1 [Aplysia californica]XP_005102658.1 zinc transporter ZIP1 [Aplysia californica]
MDATIAKVITLVVLIILTIAFSCLPYFLVLRGSRSLVSSRVRDVAFACLNCFAGGVFLGTFLLHLMTEGSEEFEHYKTHVKWETEFPFFNTFVVAGFFLVALVEHFMHSCLQHTHGESEDRESLLRHDAQDTTRMRQHYGAIEPHPSNTVPQTGSQYSQHHKKEPGLAETRLAEGGTAPPKSDGPDSQAEHPVSVEYRSDRSDTHGGGGEILTNGLRQGGLQAFLLLMALSFHTIFDGLAVGLQKDANEVWQVFAAIAVHKSIIAFCLGLEMFKNYAHSPVKAFLWMCLFSLMSPIGIGLGIILTSGNINEDAKDLSSSILQGVAAGTFLYVTFLEILCSYMGHRCVKSRFIYILCSAAGFGIMAFVKVLDSDDH